MYSVVGDARVLRDRRNGSSQIFEVARCEGTYLSPVGMPPGIATNGRHVSPLLDFSRGDTSVDPSELDTGDRK